MMRRPSTKVQAVGGVCLGKTTGPEHTYSMPGNRTEKTKKNESFYSPSIVEAHKCAEGMEVAVLLSLHSRFIWMRCGTIADADNAA